MTMASDIRGDIVHTDERSKELEERYESYEVYDNAARR